ncbi:MAG: glycosyltransferase [Bacteroidia bacterium]|nr:glycosyltransferase [Bacteroidia bacterium]
MRIGFDGKRYFNNKTGLGNYSRSLVHLLAENFPNDECVLFTEKPAETEVQLPNLRVFAPEKKGLFWRSFGMAKDAQNMGIDVFHGLSNEIPFGLKKRGIKAVVTIHDVIFKRYPGLYPVFDRLIYHLKTKMALKNADKVLATSKATAHDLDA